MDTSEVAHQRVEVVEEEHRELGAARAAPRKQDGLRDRVATPIAAPAALLGIATDAGDEASVQLETGGILTADAHVVDQAKNVRQTAYQLAADDIELTLRNGGVTYTLEARQAFQRQIDAHCATATRANSFEPLPDRTPG